MTKDIVPQGFTLGLALVDFLPVLFFGAGDDSVNPVNSVRAVYDDIRTPKHLVMVDKCEHNMCYDRAPAAYERETRQFVEKCVVRLVSTGKM